MKYLGTFFTLAVVSGTAWLLVTPSNRNAQDSMEINAAAPLAADDKTEGSLTAQVNAYLALLDATQRGKSVMSYDSQERTTWNFVPLPTRKGLVLSEMNEQQQAAALKVVRAALSQSGYDKATKIMSLENILLKLEGAASIGRRDPLKYYVSVYGDPTGKEPWGLSFEGHHLSLNFVIAEDKVVESTPQFMATNPAELRADFGEGFPKGLRVLDQEETLAFDLVTSLTPEQKKEALISEKALPELRGPNTLQPEQVKGEGIAVSKLDAAQQAKLKSLLETYCSKMRPEVAQERLALIEKNGLENVHFAWAGPDKPGIGHYYRIQGPSFLVEFVNVQPDAAGNIANHIHCVWRDMTGDFYLPIK